MRAIIFGASGMVGQGVLRECLLDPDVESVLSVARSPSGQDHPKFRELLHGDFLDYSPLEGELRDLDACFYCLGASAAGLDEAAYRRINHDFPLAAAKVLARLNPGMTFLYISGAGTDRTGRGRAMWARVKGQTENELLALPYKAAVMLRPALIQPLHGIVAKTRWYRVFYALFKPLIFLLRPLAPGLVTTTEQLGRAMLRIAKTGAPKAILESADINRL
jgi:uncharacterized protein YbjT (DUF2867 family)